MLSKRIKILATVGLVAVIGGVGAGAGVLIYQSTNRTTAAGTTELTNPQVLRDLFPDAREFTHYPFLNYVKTSDLDIATIADIKRYGADGSRAFGQDVDRIGEAVFANALANAKYWSAWSKYQASPGLYKKTTKVQRISDGELYMASGLTDANGLTWYDVGKVSI